MQMCCTAASVLCLSPVQGVAEASGRAAVSVWPQRAQVRPGAHHRGNSTVPGCGGLQHGRHAPGEWSALTCCPG